jgi:2-C-methyl-D-erythritol 4-phosphate cytidylyltransferase
VPVAGRPLVEWSLEAFRQAESVRSIVVACPPGHVHDLGGHDLGAVEGGATRAESVRNALAAVDTELVAIHDAARPLVTPELVDEVVGALLADPEAEAAIAAAPVADTIKRASSVDPQLRQHSDAHRVIRAAEVVESTVDRTELWAAQTPQVFRTAALRAALDAYPEDAPEPTDEAMLIEAAGGRVLIHPGPAENLKVTTPLDLRVAELLLADRAR